MEYIILLRGVTPSGKNSIPKMSYLVEILTEVGFINVRTYIQSGNIILETDLYLSEINVLINRTIKEKIGADLKIIIKTKKDLTKVVYENPFDSEKYDYSRIHVVFCQKEIRELPLERLQENYGEEEIFVSNECLYLYLPRAATHKKLNTNYLEKLLGVDMTMRKINVINKLLQK
ncbi:DUF1697 domain-containing protein [Streptococcus sp. S784/96/1]|uniref:DUF1697 domain-containing protein n=1 Tax=Streptococcus sp. S784/96/1 TaxID=2653499 RepID=UPI00138A63A8|nr:DUF1697 domain-containing protein [Streptococcus sp. S784/96/1]